MPSEMKTGEAQSCRKGERTKEM